MSVLRASPARDTRPPPGRAGPNSRWEKAPAATPDGARRNYFEKSLDAPPRYFLGDPPAVPWPYLFDTEKGFPMGAKDTVVNRSRQVRGKIKDLIGRATGNPKMRASGHRDMVAGEVKQRGSVAKDRLTDL
jgi:uncharacterized protein YjbJ (UPF0337 family)